MHCPLQIIEFVEEVLLRIQKLEEEDMQEGLDHLRHHLEDLQQDPSLTALLHLHFHPHLHLVRHYLVDQHHNHQVSVPHQVVVVAFLERPIILIDQLHLLNQLLYSEQHLLNKLNNLQWTVHSVLLHNQLQLQHLFLNLAHLCLSSTL